MCTKKGWEMAENVPKSIKKMTRKGTKNVIQIGTFEYRISKKKLLDGGPQLARWRLISSMGTVFLNFKDLWKLIVLGNLLSP